jgi:carboxymethylenebutenolidase
MRSTLILAILLFAPFALAQDWAKKLMEGSPRHQEWMELKNGSRTVKAFVVYPEIKEKATVVVLIHEIMGLTDWVMLTADLLAKEGFIVIAPDFLSEMGPNKGRTDSFADVGKAREAISGLSPDQITGDLNATCDYGKGLPASNGKLVVGGFCWGGTQTFRFATQRADLKASLVFYGSPPTDASLLSKIASPVYGFYGGNDARINATIPDTEKAMKAAGKTYEPVTYEGAGHGFMRAGQMPEAQEANAKGRSAAWERILKILKGIS